MSRLFKVEYGSYTGQPNGGREVIDGVGWDMLGVECDDAKVGRDIVGV